MSETDTGEGTLWALIHPGAPRGVFTRPIARREQDAVAEPGEFYVVAFFPKVDCLGPASMKWPSTISTISRSPEAAIAKFMDGIKQGETWATYEDAGHKVRKVRIVDLGDAS